MSKLLKVNPNRPQRKIIHKAAEIIRNGGLVAFPTETVYGIAAHLGNSKELDRIKNRPKGKPYTIHIAHKKDLYKFVKKITPLAKKIIKKYWPGPLTLILKDRFGKKVGFRMPDNRISLALIRAVGEPIIAPSANVSSRPSPIRANQVCTAALAAGVDLIIDGGPTKYRKDSTVLDLTLKNPRILREGCVKLNEDDIVCMYR